MIPLRIIADGETRLAIHIPKDEILNGLQFYSRDEDFIQVGTWGYARGKKLLPHIHNSGVTRSIDRTQEVVHVIEGELKAAIFAEDERLVDEIIIRAGDTLVLLAGGHGYDILADGTKVLEVKNGPYMGPERDRRRIGLASEGGNGQPTREA